MPMGARETWRGRVCCWADARRTVRRQADGIASGVTAGGHLMVGFRRRPTSDSASASWGAHEMRSTGPSTRGMRIARGLIRLSIRRNEPCRYLYVPKAADHRC